METDFFVVVRLFFGCWIGQEEGQGPFGREEAGEAEEAELGSSVTVTILSETMRGIGYLSK